MRRTSESLEPSRMPHNVGSYLDDSRQAFRRARTASTDIISKKEDGTMQGDSSAGAGGHSGWGYSPTTPATGHGDEQLEEEGDGVRDVRELCDLQQRIYRSTTSEAPLPVLCDDMADITPCLLHISNRMIQRTQQSDHDVHQQQPSPTNSASSDISSAEDGLDIITVLLLIAAYGRLYDFFNHVCLTLRRHLSRRRAPESYPTRWSKENPAAGGGSSEGDSRQCTTAQFVMVTELMSHLLGRLERGQEHLMAAVNVESLALSESESRSPSPAAEEEEEEDTSMEGVEATARTARAAASSDSLVQGAMALLEALESRHAALQAQVATIRRIAENSGQI